MNTLRRLFLLLLLLGGGVSPTRECNAQDRQASWVTGPRANAFWDLLAGSPYAQAGDHGLTVYMLTNSQCANCLVFLREFWEPNKERMQLREVFAPINQPQLLDEAADIALTRDPARAQAYYAHRIVAPKVQSSRERRAALDEVVAFTTKANAFFGTLGHVRDGYPTFIFRITERGRQKLMIISGYGPDFAKDLGNWVAADTSRNAAQ